MSNNGTLLQKDREWINYPLIAVLLLGRATIYLLPYMRGSYYQVMIETFGMTNFQLGLIASIFGINSALSQIFGGYLADRFSTKTLLIISYIATGLGGFYFATIPPYRWVIILHIMWGITTTLTFWPALYKAVRLSASVRNHSKAMGYTDGGAKIGAGLISIAGVALFAKFGGGEAGFKGLVLFYSCVLIAIGLATYFLWPKEIEQQSTETKSAAPITVKDFLMVAKAPVVWLIAGIVFFGYASSLYFAYVNGYFTSVLGFDITQVALFVGAGKNFILAIGIVAAGFLAAKFRPSRTKISYLVILALGYLGIVLLPGKMAFLVIPVLLAMLTGNALMTLTYTLLPEAGVPVKITGSVIGVAATIGYSSELFVPLVIGHILDRFPGALGYQINFVMAAGLALLSVVFVVLFLRIIKKPQKAFGSIYQMIGEDEFETI